MHWPWSSARDMLVRHMLCKQIQNVKCCTPKKVHEKQQNQKRKWLHVRATYRVGSTCQTCYPYVTSLSILTGGTWSRKLLSSTLRVIWQILVRLDQIPSFQVEKPIGSLGKKKTCIKYTVDNLTGQFCFVASSCQTWRGLMTSPPVSCWMFGILSQTPGSKMS